MLCKVIVYKYSNGRINQINQKIIVQKKLTLICSKLIFRRLLVKLATECAYKFNNRFLKQVDGLYFGGALSVTFNNIYVIKIEDDIVVPSKLNLLSKAYR